jgi:twitching motility protein PilU
MQTFDQALFDLYEGNHVTYEDALRNADSVNDLRLQIKLKSQRARNPDLAAGTEHMPSSATRRELNAPAPRA